MPNLVNRLTVRQLTNNFEGAENYLLVSFAGLTVVESETLRNLLAKQGVGLRMVRNSLARVVFAERGMEFSREALEGNTAIAWGDIEGVIAAAKAFTSPEVKKAGKVKIKAGVLEGNVLGMQDAVSIADMPDKNTLRAMLLGVLSGPARSLATVVAGVPSGFARVLQGRADQLGGGDAA